MVFFDDILVYNKTLQDHIVHLETVLKILQKNYLFAKYYKCSFGSRRVEYLGHFIEANGVSTNPKKVEAITNWPAPTNIKELWGFLGLTGYYKIFVQGYGIISKPLIALLKNDAFTWNE